MFWITGTKKFSYDLWATPAAGKLLPFVLVPGVVIDRYDVQRIDVNWIALRVHDHYGMPADGDGLRVGQERNDRPSGGTRKDEIQCAVV
jgi:hypothetical protein